MRLAVLLLALVASSFRLPGPPVDLVRNCAAAAPVVQVAALPQGHAHNDYRHAHPLTSALREGFTSVEADVWPVRGRLLVAHDRDQVEVSRSLDSLYLHPLARAFRQRERDVEPDAAVQLLVDVKGAPASTLPLLRAELAPYAGMLTRYRASDDGCATVPGPVSVVVSGNAHPVAPRAGTTALFGYDQPLQPGGGSPGAEAVAPLASGDWADLFTWDGVGPMPAEERGRLLDLVAAAHAAGSRVRFWDTPDDPGRARDALWQELAADGVDYLNTDDLSGYAAFVRSGRAGDPVSR